MLPRWVRRVTIAPGLVLLVGLVIVNAPLILLVMAAISPLMPGRLRPLRFAWVAFVYLVLDAGLLVVLFGLWVATGFGLFVGAPWSQRAHYALLGWALRVLESEAHRVLRVTIRRSGADPDAFRDRPLLVLVRHAGAGDSFLIADLLINWYQREPRIVLKALLQWDPAVDVLLNRLPTVFVDNDPGIDRVALVRRLASNLDNNDAFTIFPEGGNFTPHRRLSRITWLRSHGREQYADQAEDLRNVLAPRQAGTAAALAAAPEADVAIVAHTGLEHLTSLKAFWRYLPMDTEIRVHWWRIPAAEAPRHPEEVTDWLFGWWGLVDDWIEANRPAIVTAALADPDTPTPRTMP
jgi:1-acyl-sn-glycerol-3-phosphate acyltransferase